MSEFITVRKILSAAALSLLLTACSQETTSSESESPDSPISSAVEEVKTRLECYVAGDPFSDCDKDGVANAADVNPGRDDLADDDGDGVINKRDKYQFLDDKTMDIDTDGTPDYLDTFYGDNFGDEDGDYWLNGIDPQPYTAPPASSPLVAGPPNLTDAELNNLILNQQMVRKFTIEALDRPDADYDGIPDDVDTTRTEYTNDRDGDGDPDFYDPKPGDDNINSRNDPYDPRNEEYYEDDY